HCIFSRERRPPYSRLVLIEQIVGKSLDVAGGILQFVPLWLRTRTEIPESMRPTADVTQLVKVASEVVPVRNPRPTVPVKYGIHDESHTHDPDAMHQPGLPRRLAPCVVEYIPYGRPVVDE